MVESEKRAEMRKVPRLSESEKREIAARYARGESLEALRSEFGCWRCHAQRAVRKYGGRLRAGDDGPLRCRICGEPAAGNSKRNLCAGHVRRFCSRCEAEMPEGRVCRWCYACGAANKEQLYARRLPCSQCGTKIRTPRSTVCADCAMAIYRMQRQVALAHPKACADCRIPLPKGRINRRCLRCHRKWERARRRDRRRLGLHRCVMCGTNLRLADQSLCKGCNTMVANFRRAWHAGNEVARRLGTIKTPRRWQEARETGDE